MSLETWKAEFYPTDARDCPEDQAIEHSLRKWRGLRPDILKKHGVTVSVFGHLASELDGDRLSIDARTCALCERFFADSDDEPCNACPLAQSRKGAQCDHLAANENTAPWWAWSDNKNPEPMIAALEKALADKEGGAL